MSSDLGVIQNYLTLTSTHPWQVSLSINNYLTYNTQLAAYIFFNCNYINLRHNFLKLLYVEERMFCMACDGGKYVCNQPWVVESSNKNVYSFQTPLDFLMQCSGFFSLTHFGVLTLYYVNIKKYYRYTYFN